ncbi:ATPase [Granulicella sp. 5B5]|uniref:ATP synthase F0 subunit B n=1 Tax=Granulicella sp. 5B5 TaxID=1617967 RepID=UPI0015F3EBB1|nr:ATP synthase F0 subunit B [Granulicella sp. 5B5]QMV17990.1 ATPase [Granulicella sp. 5B5]
MTRRVWASMMSLVVLLALAMPVRVAHAQAAATVPVATKGTDAASTQAKPAAQDEEEKDDNDEYRMSPTVTKLGSLLGMKSEAASTAFTITNLVILLAGLGYLIMKNLPKSFKSRSATIQKQIVEARTATQDAKSRLSSVEARLAKLDGEIAAMRTQAEADGAREEQRLKSAIEDEKQRILAAAGQEIQSATLTARRELQQYAAELAVDQAARKLVVTPEADRYLVAGFAERLKAFGKGEN